jgi:aspartyl protease family protein
LSDSNGDQALTFLYLVGCLVLVASALAVRRVPIGQGLKMAAGWVLIFAAAFVGFTLKDDFMALGRRVMRETSGEAQMVQTGKETRIRKAEDGHFWVDAKVNGERVRFLVDSGATTTSLSTSAARRAGVKPDGGFPVLVNTANGVVTARRAHVRELKVGTIERSNLAVETADAFGETSVLGMNFLSSLSGWGVDGQWLVLKP